jgi:hypothetical protein
MPMLLHNSPQFAVEFGKNVDKGFEGGMDAWPFIYTFVSANDDHWDQLHGLSDIGPTVPALGKINKAVILDPDYAFKLLAIKYVAYKEVAGAYWWHDTVPGLYVDTVEPTASVHDMLLRNIRINLSVAPSYRLLYGQENNGQQSTDKRSPYPLPASIINNGIEGDGKLRTPILMAANAQLSFEIYNDWSFPVTVGAAIFGMKIRI